jgi:protein disulfide-isomerase
MGLFGKSVIQVTPENFSGKKLKHPMIDSSTKGLIVFYADWCGHCKKTAPVYTKVANALGKSFPLFAFDCVAYKEFSQKLNIEGFPTIRYINKDGSLGKMYSSDRTLEAFLADICKESMICK